MNEDLLTGRLLTGGCCMTVSASRNEGFSAAGDRVHQEAECKEMKGSDIWYISFLHVS
jgi:hypothetical protein